MGFLLALINLHYSFTTPQLICPSLLANAEFQLQKFCVALMISLLILVLQVGRGKDDFSIVQLAYPVFHEGILPEMTLYKVCYWPCSYKVENAGWDGKTVI